MEALKTAIQERGIRYILKGDVYLPELELPEESRPIGHWGRLHKGDYPIICVNLLRGVE